VEDVMDLVMDAIELMACAVAFWAFVCSPETRRRCVARYRNTPSARRWTLALESAMCAFCGLLPIATLGALLA
jgi:hypothetical protein